LCPGICEDGTYVQPHCRSAPDGNPYNDWSFPGNMNPYTGKVATGNPETWLRNFCNGRTSTRRPVEPMNVNGRLDAVPRLRRKGVEVDWRRHSLLQLWDVENRLDSANSPKEKGAYVDRRQYPLSQLLDMDIRTTSR